MLSETEMKLWNCLRLASLTCAVNMQMQKLFKRIVEPGLCDAGFSGEFVGLGGKWQRHVNDRHGMN